MLFSAFLVQLVDLCGEDGDGQWILFIPCWNTTQWIPIPIPIRIFWGELNWFSSSSSFRYSTQKSRNLDIEKSFVEDEEFEDDVSDDAVPDEAFYYTEVEAEIETNEPNIKSPNPPSPPTLSHRYTYFDHAI